ncbi:RND superfamily putative drug exporter [Catenulispora sp. GP43]|uniref:MMPL family transporter n=1 Tax=Catenulispora sp. GP43 TaxID=3156263 RepID=UPI0035176570
MTTLARWCHRHRLLTLFAWLALIVGLGVLSGAAKPQYDNKLSIPASESSRAVELLKTVQPAADGDSDSVVWHTAQGRVTDAAVQQRMTKTLDRIAKAPGIASVASPYGPQGKSQISPDGTTAYATLTFTQEAGKIPVDQAKAVAALADAARTDGLQVELGGAAVSIATDSGGGSQELVGVLAALVVLGLVFRSVGAAVLPILTGVAGVSTGVLVVGLLSHSMALPSSTPILATLVGLGVGIDYALFIVNRHRKGLMAGLSVEEAMAKALDTSGRAVLFAGGSVVIALLGMFALGLDFLNGMALGAALTVAMTVLAAVTLLPALLGLLKTMVLSRRQRKALKAWRASGTDRVSVRLPRRSGPAQAQNVFTRWAGRVERRPFGKAVLALAVMAVIALPVLSLRMGSSDAGNDPKASTTRQAYDLLAKGFGPGFNGPLLLVAEVPAAADGPALDRLVQQLRTTPGVAAAEAAPLPPGQKVAVVQVVPTTAPQDQGTSDLIHRLRTDVVPAAERGTTLHVLVGGQTAMSDDFDSALNHKLPAFVGIIVGLGCLLMMLAFRSVLVPLIGVAMNLLTMGAAFGALVAVFQWGWGSEALGVGGAGPVDSFVPVMVIGILFGLSMDYQVFLISRMHEEWTKTGDNHRAVRVGHGETGQVICAAAVIMACVFGSFIVGGQRMIAEFGVALAVSILLDVLLLRMILVPALMHGFGRGNWWLPRILDRLLPRLSVEGSPESAATVWEPEPEPLPEPEPEISWQPAYRDHPHSRAR